MYRTGKIEVSLKPHGSHGEFGISRAQIGHSQMPQVRIDCRGVFFFARRFFTHSMTIFRDPKNREDKIFSPLAIFSQLYSIGK